MSFMQKRRPVKEFTDENREYMSSTHAKGDFLSRKDLRDVVSAIKNTIKNEELKIRKKHQWLNHQDLLGMAFFLSSSIAVVGSAVLYLQGYIHWSITMLVIALGTSILHELEHDLIHNLYFKTHRWVQHLMFTFIWFFKMNVPPWYRKILHLRHHLVSGQREDIEERLIGLGLPLGFWRWVRSINHPVSVAMDGAGSIHDIMKDSMKDFKDHGFTVFRIFCMAMPTLGLSAIVFHVLLSYARAFMGWTLTSYDPALYLPMWLWPYVRDIAVIIVLPNFFRNACLSLTASYCHYYGDIPEDSVFYQNQILEHWLLYPLHLFSFNFGCTHAIHHYVPNQPFYIRQLISARANKAMVERGVRINDWDIIRRNNRFFEVDLEKENRLYDERIKKEKAQ